MTARVRAEVPFAMVPLWLVHHREVKDVDVRVYAALCAHVDYSNREGYVTQDTIARLLAVSPDTIARSWKRLERAGAVAFERTAGVANLITLMLRQPGPPAAVPPPPRKSAGGTPRKSAGGPIYRELLLEVVEENMPAAPASKPTGGYVAGSTLAAFEAFWGDYPKPRRVDKKKAYRAFTEAAREGADVATGLNRWLTFWKDAGTETQFIPWATTWLNQRRWETDPGPGRPQRSPNGATVARRPNMITDRTIPEGIE